MSEVAPYSLPARLDLTTAAEVAGALGEARGGDIALDATHVTHLGTPGVQVLLAARRTWREDGHVLEIQNFGPSLEDQLQTLGLNLSDLTTVPELASLQETSSVQVTD